MRSSMPILVAMLLSGLLGWPQGAEAVTWIKERPKLTREERLGEQEEPSPSTAQSLGYGVMLYEYFLDNNFEALREYGVAETRRELGGHGKYPQIMQGGIGLAFGLESEAEQRFQELLKGAYSDGVHSQAWYYLGRIAYKRRHFERSIAALSNVDSFLPDRMKDEYRALVAQLAVHYGDFDRAEDASKRIDTQSPLKAYANFNIGAAYQRQFAKQQQLKAAESSPNNDLAEMRGEQRDDVIDRTQPWFAASEALDDAARYALDMQWDEVEGVHKDEFPALADRSLLASGYALLQGGLHAEAVDRFRRVRLEGPYAARAMLGYGWAEVKRENYEAALTPWGHLVKRPLIIPAVQEAYLGVPYIYQKLGAENEALKSYEIALESYKSELERIGAAVDTLKTAPIQDLFVVDQSADYANWVNARDFAELNPQSPYLTDLLAGNQFHSAVSDIRDLYALRSNLTFWKKKLVFLESAIDSRRNAHRSLREAAGPQLEARIRDVKTRRLEIEKRQAAFNQSDQLDRPINDGHGSESNLDALIELMNNRKLGLDELLAGEPEWKIDGARLQKSTEQLEATAASNDAGIKIAERYLADLAIARLADHEALIQGYIAHANLAIARLYDKNIAAAAEAERRLLQGLPPIEPEAEEAPKESEKEESGGFFSGDWWDPWP